MPHILSSPVQLTLDLRFAPSAKPFNVEGRFLDLDGLATMTQAPRELVRLLWGTRYHTVRVLEDYLPPSGVQAGALGLAALTRSRYFQIQKPDGLRRMSRVRLLTLAIGRFAIAMPREIWHSLRTGIRAERIASTDFKLPHSTTNAASVAYIRAEPSLHWAGAYVGGAATHTTGVINGLVANGLDVHIYTPSRPAGIEGAAVTEVPLRRPYHLIQWLALTDYAQEIVKAASGCRVDFVYQRYALGSYVGLDLARRLNVPLVLEYNGSEIWAHKNWGTGGIRLVKTLAAVEHRNIRGASLIVVVSEVLKEQLIKHGIPAARILVNPNGVDVDKLAPLRERTPAEWREQTVQPEAPTVGFIGTFGLWHGVRVLPAIIDAVAEQRADVRWILVGDGPLHAEVRKEIEASEFADRVFISGIVEHENALRLLASCDVCISPHVPNPDGTRFFGSPTKLFEYMGLGKPIVASDLEQIGQVLDHERTGLLCRPGDAEAAANAVVRLLSDDALREKLGQAALEEARRSYSWDAHTQRILDALANGPKAITNPALSS